MNKKYSVPLTADERTDLQRRISVGRASARKLLPMQIFLKADASEGGPCWTDEQMSEALEGSPATIQRVRLVKSDKYPGKSTISCVTYQDTCGKER